MGTLALGLGVLVVAVVVLVYFRRKRPTTAEVATRLREQALRLSPQEIGLSPKPGEAWGIVMDTAYPEASASLISLADGTASIYFSTGGGVIGGHAHEAVSNAARSFVRSATSYLARLTVPTDESLPKPGNTRFFVLTAEGKRFAEASEQALGEGKHELSPLFYAGQNVITQLRLISQKSQTG